MAETRISPYSLNDLKNTTDDALANYLRGLHFHQDNTKLDVRLAIGYASVVIAAATFVADYKLGWEATKGWTAVAVVAYALLNGAFTYWTWAVEKGCVFDGVKDGRKVRAQGDVVKIYIWMLTIHLDLRCIQDQQARADILPHRHGLRFGSEHTANPGALHHVVHGGRLLRREAFPAMVGYKC